MRTDLLGTDGFQEADTFGITMPIVKHSFMIQHPLEIPRVIHEAFHIARTGRPGPVLIDMPVDLTRVEIDYEPVDDVHLPGYQPTTEGNQKQIRLAAKALANARRPVLYVGGGVDQRRRGRGADRARARRALPGHLHADGPRRASRRPTSSGSGMLGMHGTRAANYAMDEADLIVAPARASTTASPASCREFAPRAKFIHIDIDPAEISKNVPAHIPIVGDAKNILAPPGRGVRALETDPARLNEWWERIEGWRAQHPLRYEDSTDDEIKPQCLIEALYEATGGDAIVTSDVGQHQMWTAQYFHFARPRRWINSGGLGTMGFGLPAAIGAADRAPGPQTVVRLRRRLDPDEHPGAGDDPRERRPGEGLPDEQRLPRHGPPVAGALLGPPLLARGHGQLAGLRQARRGLRDRRAPADGEDDARRGHAGDHRRRRPGVRRRPRHPRGEHVPDDRARRRRAGHGGLRWASREPRRCCRSRTSSATAGVRTGRKHILSILVENKPGVLTRVAGLFARRGFNIDTLVVGPTDDPTLSRITLTLDGAMHPIDQVTKQLHKLVNVIKIRDLEPDDTIARELAVFKISADGAARAEIMQIVEIFEARVDRRHASARSSSRSSARPTKVEAFEKLVRPFGLIEMAQTGEIAIARGRGET